MRQRESYYLLGGRSTLCFKTKSLNRWKLSSTEFIDELIFASMRNISVMMDMNVEVRRASNACCLQKLLISHDEQRKRKK